MSSLITKATKRGLSASKRIRATKGKKATSRKPKRPGTITAAPKSKKATTGKKLPQTKKSKQTTSARKQTGGSSRKVVAKKKKVTAAPVKVKVKVKKVQAPKRASQKKPAAKVIAAKARASKPKSRKALLARRRAIVPKPLPAPPKKLPSPGALAAVRAFEQALRSFNRQDFNTAKSAFLGVLGKFAEQAEIVARSRTYLAICEQRLARSPSMPRNADALYNQGVFEFNRGSTTEAIELFEKALKVEPRADHVYYSLAAAYARLNEAPKAMDALRRAIGIRPVQRSHARRDVDFAGLRSNEDFQQLTGFGFDLVDE